MDIRQEILSGKTLEEIGREVGVSKQRIKQICDSQGIDVKALKAEKEKSIIELIRQLASEGFSIGEISNKLQMTYCQVKNRTSKNNIKCTPKRGGVKEF